MFKCWANADIADEVVGAVGEMLTLADKGGRVGWGIADNG